MAKPSISMPDELLEEFDKTLEDAGKADIVPYGKERSAIVRELMSEWIEETQQELEDQKENLNLRAVCAD